MPGRSSWRILVTLALVTGLFVTSFAPTAAQQARISLIRDAEIEATLQRFSRPIFEAAGLGSDSVRLYIVKDDRLNAFVAYQSQGTPLFLNTGLLMRTEHPGQLAGVVAHEVGHIAGGHLSRIPAAQRRATAEMVLATLLGAAAAVAGAPELGTAIISGGQSYATGGYLRFSRSQEEQADQAAITYLNRAGISPRGLAEFLRILESQNALAFSSMNPYLQTHPLARARVAFVENQARGAPSEGVPPDWQDAHARMVVKLRAFLEEPRQVLRRYEGDDSLYGRYARAIALYRLPDLQRAQAEIDALIEEHPDDPYFHELKGQMLFENGRIDAAIEPYGEAVRLKRDSALLRVGLAQALIETGAEDAYRSAISHLEEAIRFEENNATAWRLLGIARGRTGKQGESDMALAEYALLVGRQDDAKLYARRAQERIERSDPAWLRLQDLLRVIEEG